MSSTRWPRIPGWHSGCPAQNGEPLSLEEDASGRPGAGALGRAGQHLQQRPPGEICTRPPMRWAGLLRLRADRSRMSEPAARVTDTDDASQSHRSGCWNAGARGEPSQLPKAPGTSAAPETPRTVSPCARGRSSRGGRSEPVPGARHSAARRAASQPADPRRPGEPNPWLPAGPARQTGGSYRPRTTSRRAQIHAADGSACRYAPSSTRAASSSSSNHTATAASAALCQVCRLESPHRTRRSDWRPRPPRPPLSAVSASSSPPSRSSVAAAR